LREARALDSIRVVGAGNASEIPVEERKARMISNRAPLYELAEFYTHLYGTNPPQNSHASRRRL
jgi:hypothetical protein